MVKSFSIVVVIMLGFFLMPSVSYACGKHHDKKGQTHFAIKFPQSTISASTNINSCCGTETSQSCKKGCCDKKNSQNGNHDDGCSGKCGHSSCHCPTVNFGFTLPFFSEPKQRFIVAFKKQFFTDTDPYISSGFYSIWLPPKIS